MATVHLNLEDIDYSRTKTVSDFTAELLRRNDLWISEWSASPDWHLTVEVDDAAGAAWLLQRAEEVRDALDAANAIQDNDIAFGQDPIELSEFNWHCEP